MKKRIFFLLSFLIISIKIFAYDGVMSGQKDLRIVKTRYFDVIYAPGSAVSAKLMQEKADAVYEEVAEKFQLEYKFRLPVVISPSLDTFNAYFSSFPFNHIVMYDTLPDEGMMVFEETFINTFRHELIHGITYNLRNKTWYNIDKVLGDVYNPALLTITTGWAEGATVSVESDFGEGRMNSEYAKHIIRQAKIDGVFPKYSEIQGAMDFYPGTTASYIFGGAFCKWLQDTYGIEKYSQFWHNCVNFKTLTYFTCFKKVYGMPIKQAWEKFYDSIEIPEGIQIGKHKIKGISYYKSLTASENGYAYIDMYKNGVYFKANEKKRAKLLLTQFELEKISLSKDGKLLAVSYMDSSYPTEKNRVYLYDLKTKASFAIPEIDVRDATVIQKNRKYYIACVKTDSEYSKLLVYKIVFYKSGKIAKLNLVSEQSFDYGKQPFSLEGDKNGNLYYVLKKGLDFSICQFNIDSNSTKSVVMPEHQMMVQKLSVYDDKVYFSYAKSGTMPRLGYLKETENGTTLNLSKNDISGGIFNPVLDMGNVRYIASYLKGFKIQTINPDSLNFDEISVEFAAVEPTENQIETQKIDGKEIEESKKFNPLAYSFTGPKGSFIPVALTASSAINGSAENMLTTLMPVGITYFSASPWTNPIYYVSAGYGILTNSYALKAGVYKGGSTTGLFSYSGSAQVEFDENGYKQTFETFKIGSNIPLFRTFSLGFSEKFEFFEGRQSKTTYDSDEINSIGDYFGILSKEKYGEDLSINRLFLGNSVTASIGNIHRAGKNYFNYAGIKASTSLDLTFCTRVSDFDNEYYKFGNISFGLSGRIPGYVPIALEASLFPKQLYVGYFAAKAYLLSFEIQKSTNILPLIYLNRINLTAQYTGKFKEESETYIKYFESWPIKDTYDYITDVCDGTAKYYDQLAFMANLYFTPNIGGFARTDFQLKASMGYVFRFSPEPEETSGGLALSIAFENITF